MADDRQANAWDLHRWMVAEKVPHLYWGTINGMGLYGFTVGWTIRANGKTYFQRLPWPENYHGQRCKHPETGDSYTPEREAFRPGPDDTCPAGWKTFDEAVAEAERRGLVEPGTKWTAAVGRHRDGVWFPVGSPMPKGVKAKKVSGWPCAVSSFASSSKCFGVAEEQGGLCKTHAGHQRRRQERAAEWNAKWDAQREERKRDEELRKAAAETCGEINALVADLLDIELDAKPANTPAGHVTIDHETARRLVLNLVDRL